MAKQNLPDSNEFDSTESGPFTSSPSKPVEARATGSTPVWVWVAGGCGCAAVVVVLLGVGLMTFVIGRLNDGAERVRETRDRTVSQNNMRHISLGNINYLNTQGRFPASYSTDSQGRPLLSWRVHLLPYLEHNDLYDQFNLDEPWDSPHNQALIPLMPDVYRSLFSQAGEGMTVYLGNAVEGGAFAKPTGQSSSTMAGYKPSDFTDGQANTVLVVEVNDEHAVTWTKPADFDPPLDSDIASWLRLDREQNYQAALVDGAPIRESAVDRKHLKGRLTRDGGEVLERQYVP